MPSDPTTTTTSSPTASTTDPSESSTHSRQSSSNRPQRKSPPPPKLNLDDCKPNFADTTRTTSNTPSAFVFTSSRTLKSLHGHSHSASDGAVPPTPSVQSIASPYNSQPSSPVTTTAAPASSSPTSSHTRKHSKPSLSPAQLARHSQGAVDARCVVSPSMRAAGFVPLVHSPLNGPHGASMPPTPGSAASVPTPADPPRFPPLVFVTPSNVTTTSMWDYQRTMAYGLGLGPSSGLALSSADASTPARVVVSGWTPDFAVSSSSVPGLDRASQVLSSFNSSHYSLFSSASASSSQTSISLASSASSSSRMSGRQHLQSPEARPAPVDGYPFPQTPPRSRNPSHSPMHVNTSPVHGLEQTLGNVTKSPSTAGSTASGSVTPLAASPTSSITSLPPSTISFSSPMTPSARSESLSSELSRVSLSSKGTDSRSTPRSNLSITELCSLSPRAWVADPGLLPPPTVKESRKGRTKTTSGRVIYAPVASEADGRARESLITDEGAARSVVTDKVPEKKFEEKVEELPRTAPASLLLPATVVDEVEVAKDNLKEREKHRGREKDRDRDREKVREKDRERRRQKGKSTRDRSSSSPTSTTPSPGREEKGKDQSTPTRKSKDRTRSTKEKALGYSAYSSFSFPPRDAKTIAHTHAHTLGGRDPILEREREREAGEYAKDIVLAHLERDREYARQTDAWHSSSVRGTHKKRFAPDAAMQTPPHTFSTAYDAGYGRGIARGRGRGEHTSLRGRSGGKNVISVASSIVSESETMVYEQLDLIDSEPEAEQAVLDA